MTEKAKTVDESYGFFPKKYINDDRIKAIRKLTEKTSVRGLLLFYTTLQKILKRDKLKRPHAKAYASLFPKGCL